MQLSSSRIKELKFMVNEALERVYLHDAELIQFAVNERSIVFRFAHYFGELLIKSSFNGFHLDCEYNRNMGKSKRTLNFQNGVIPDILLHRRNSNTENILVLEFKGYWNKSDRSKDHLKIIDFISQADENIYKYGIGGLVELGNGSFNVEYFLDYEPQVI